MEETNPSKATMRFLSFANSKEDAEKEAKLKEAAAKIEQAMAKHRALGELIDVKEEQLIDQQIDLAQDTRSLYERLQEQRDKKKESHDESHKPSNWVTKLDDDDIEYLNEVAKTKREEEIRRRLEIQDAFDAKKRLEEQKMLIEQKRMKESLLGKSTQADKAAPRKSRLSSLMKMKSRIKSKDSVPVTNSGLASQNNKIVDAGTSSSSGPRSNSPKTQTEPSCEVSSRIKTDIPKDEPVNEDGATKTLSCSCSKDVMTSLGILPSLPMIKDARDFSDKDSDNSDDDLNDRLVPHGRKRRK